VRVAGSPARCGGARGASPVNPNANTVGGDPVVADLASVPGELSQQWAARLRPVPGAPQSSARHPSGASPTAGYGPLSTGSGHYLPRSVAGRDRQRSWPLKVRLGSGRAADRHRLASGHHELVRGDHRRSAGLVRADHPDNVHAADDFLGVADERFGTTFLCSGPPGTEVPECRRRNVVGRWRQAKSGRGLAGRSAGRVGECDANPAVPSKAAS
jgi:hypothetical protein